MAMWSNIAWDKQMLIIKTFQDMNAICDDINKGACEFKLSYIFHVMHPIIQIEYTNEIDAWYELKVE